MKKKVLVTRRLLKENEEKLKELFEVTLNKDDKIYKPQEIIDNSKKVIKVFIYSPLYIYYPHSTKKSLI